MLSYQVQPVEIKKDVPNGIYRVTIHIQAEEDQNICVFAQHRSFVVRDQALKQGEVFTKTFIVAVFDRNFFGVDYEKADGIKIEVLSEGKNTVQIEYEIAKLPTLYICGDSTVTDQGAEYPFCPLDNCCGWGQAFGMLTKQNIAVANHAQSGSCTSEFMASNLTAFESQMKKGDFMVIEFGHNDQKKAELSARSGYRENLIRLVNIAREKGAEPIICSPINRIIFEEDGTLKNLLGEYRVVCKEVADELGVNFIDLWQRTTEYFETAGPVKSIEFFYHKKEGGHDYTHTNDIGGTLIAKFFAQEMIKIQGVLMPYIAESLIKTQMVYKNPEDKVNNAAELAHIKTIGLVNVPENIDADVTGLQA